MTIASMVSYMISTVKIGISNIIESQTLSSSCSGSFSGSLFEINNFLNLLVSLVFSCPLLDRHLHMKCMTNSVSFIYIYYSHSLLFLFKVALISLPNGLFTRISEPVLFYKLTKRSVLLVMYSWLISVMNSKYSVIFLFFGCNS